MVDVKAGELMDLHQANSYQNSINNLPENFVNSIFPPTSNCSEIPPQLPNDHTFPGSQNEGFKTLDLIENWQPPFNHPISTLDNAGLIAGDTGQNSYFHGRQTLNQNNRESLAAPPLRSLSGQKRTDKHLLGSNSACRRIQCYLKKKLRLTPN